MENEEVLKIHINPNNRKVSTTDPKYIEAWTEAFESRRDEIEAELKEKVTNGELEIPVAEPDPSTPLKVSEAMRSTSEDALHFRAHSLAEQDMQSWALRRGIGMVGISGGQDHGQLIEYIDDPRIPFLGYEIDKSA
jgi:hypothetical protein